MKKTLLAGAIVAVAFLLSGCMAVAYEGHVHHRHAHTVYVAPPTVVEVVPAPGPHGHHYPGRYHRW